MKRLQTLARRKGRQESGLFLAEGVRIAEDLLASGVVPHLALISSSLEDTARGAELAAALRARVRTEAVSESELARLADAETPQGVIIAAEIPRSELPTIHPGATSLGIVLDAVQDPGNFGTIVRSADAFGASFVAVLPGSVDPWNAKAVRSAAGASLRVPIIETDLNMLLAFLQAEGYTLLGADMAGVAVDTRPAPRRVALALGNEGAGLSDAVRSACAALVSIPIRVEAESLNVGVAAGILCYLLTRESST